MKIKAQIFLLSLFSITISNAFADNCSPCSTTKQCCDDGNKTFLMPRSYNYNLALDTTAGWWKLTHRAHLNQFGGNFGITTFYESSERDDTIGKYFSPQRCPQPSTPCASTCGDCPGNNNFTFGARLGIDQTITQDLNIHSFVQMPFPDLSAQATSTKTATMNLEMNRRAYGFNLNYHHNFDSVLRGFFFTVKIPVVHVEHNVDVCLTGNDWKVGAGDQDLVKAATSVNALQDYFNGRNVELPLVTDDAATEQMNFNDLDGNPIFTADFPVLQECLKCGIIPVPSKNACSTACPRKDRSITGIADIDWTFGYHVINQEMYTFALNVGVTIPTGNSVKSLVVWEPMLGNGRHWALGCGAEGAYRAWGTREHNISLITALNFRYLFENCQDRILGLCGIQWGQYRLLGKLNEKKLIPAANVLCQKVDVTPGAMVDFIAQGTWNYYGFGLDLGYNLYFRQSEKVALHDCRTIFEENTYAFPSTNFNGTTAAFTANDRLTNSTGSQRWLNDSDIDLTRAETPSQLTHKIYGSLSYLCTKRHLPLLIGITGHYEFASEESDIESWGVALKLGVSF